MALHIENISLPVIGCWLPSCSHSPSTRTSWPGLAPTAELPLPAAGPVPMPPVLADVHAAQQPWPARADPHWWPALQVHLLRCLVRAQANPLTAHPDTHGRKTTQVRLLPAHLHSAVDPGATPQEAPPRAWHCRQLRSRHFDVFEWTVSAAALALASLTVAHCGLWWDVYFSTPFVALMTTAETFARHFQELGTTASRGTGILQSLPRHLTGLLQWWGSPFYDFISFHFHSIFQQPGTTASHGRDTLQSLPRHITSPLWWCP